MELQVLSGMGGQTDRGGDASVTAVGTTAATMAVGTTAATGLLPGEPTWDQARRLLGDARRFQECSLFCQVMLGFELLGLKKLLGIVHGNNQFLREKRTCDVGKSSHERPVNIEGGGGEGGWIDVLEAQLGVSHRTAYRFMAMARTVAAKKLRFWNELRGVDLLNTPIMQLPQAAQSALAECVRRITDTKTQRDFLDELGLADSPAEAAAKGGDNDWIRWVNNYHPELVDEVGNAPTRMSVRKGNKAVFAEWEAWRLARLKKQQKATVGEAVAAVNRRFARLGDELGALAGDAAAVKVTDGALKMFYFGLQSARDWALEQAKEREIKL